MRGAVGFAFGSSSYASRYQALVSTMHAVKKLQPRLNAAIAQTKTLPRPLPVAKAPVLNDNFRLIVEGRRGIKASATNNLELAIRKCIECKAGVWLNMPEEDFTHVVHHDVVLNP